MDYCINKNCKDWEDHSDCHCKYGIRYEGHMCTDAILRDTDDVCIEVHYSDFTEETYLNIRDAQDAILEAHAEGISVDWIEDADTEELYSCIWSVELQKES